MRYDYHMEYEPNDGRNPPGSVIVTSSYRDWLSVFPSPKSRRREAVLGLWETMMLDEIRGLYPDAARIVLKRSVMAEAAETVKEYYPTALSR